MSVDHEEWADDETEPPSDQEKLVAVLGYIFPILFFVPLVYEPLKDSRFCRCHANQHLVLLIFNILGHGIAWSLVVVIIGMVILPLVVMAGLALMVVGILNVSRNECAELPLIGGFRLLK